MIAGPGSGGGGLELIANENVYVYPTKEIVLPKVAKLILLTAHYEISNQNYLYSTIMLVPNGKTYPWLGLSNESIHNIGSVTLDTSGVKVTIATERSTNIQYLAVG